MQHMFSVVCDTVKQFSASEMTCIVSSGALNSTHSLTGKQFVVRRSTQFI